MAGESVNYQGILKRLASKDMNLFNEESHLSIVYSDAGYNAPGPHQFESHLQRRAHADDLCRNN